MTERPLLLPTAPERTTPVRVLTIAGSDSGGGAGIQADMRSFALMGVHACVAVTAVTVQNSRGVSGYQEIDPAIVADQIRAVVTDIGIGAAKTGMLASSAIISSVVATCCDLGIGGDGPIPLVVDPVCASMHGDPLLAADALDAVRTELIPLATVVTPNLDEVRLITGIDVVDAHESCRNRLRQRRLAYTGRAGEEELTKRRRRRQVEDVGGETLRLDLLYLQCRHLGSGDAV